jgi:antirestriction protein ArdC
MRKENTMAQNIDRDALTAQLNDGIARLTTSDNWQKYLDSQAQLNNYSPRNIILILEQDPYATQVASHGNWQKMGRYVMKGETALRVLAPMRHTDVDPATGEESKVIKGFRFAPVFDVAQTDGKPLPEVTNLLRGDDPAGHYDRLRAMAHGIGFKVTETEFEDGRNGDCNFDTKEIRVKASNEPLQRVKTLAHELGHALLHEPSEGAERLSRDLIELEAESVAYVVGQRLGIDTGEYSFGYVAGWAGAGDKAQEMILASASRIHGATNTIIGAMEVDAADEAVTIGQAAPGGDVEAKPTPIGYTNADVDGVGVSSYRRVDVGHGDELAADRKAPDTEPGSEPDAAAEVDQFMNDHFMLVTVGFDSTPAAAHEL